MPKAKERDGVYYRKDRGTWSVSYIDAAGMRKRRVIAAATRYQAKSILEGIRVAEERARTLGIRPASDVSTDELMKRYSRHQKVRVRVTTFERLQGILDTLQASVPKQLKGITKRSVASYIETRSEVVKPGTIAKEISVLKHCLRLAVEWELIHENPAAGVQLPKLPEGRTKYLNPGELRAALTAAPQWLRAPMAFAACTGVRRGELLSLRWMDVDLANRRMYLLETKNGALRVLPLGDFAITVLRSLPLGDSDQRVFGDIDPAKVSVYTRRVFSRLGIKDASFHTLRHTAASLLVMEGVDLYAVGKILGHKTPRMTQRYAHLSPGYLAGAVAKMDGVMTGMLTTAPTGQDLVTTESPLSGG